MKFSQRVDRGEHDFYLTKLLKKGWRKVAWKQLINGHEVTLKRTVGSREETMTVTMRNNGWITVIG